MVKTTMWCASCGKYRPCIAKQRDYAEHDWLRDRDLPDGSPPKALFYSKKYPEIRWRKRIRQCDDCRTVFETNELEEKFVEELIDLRSISERYKSRIDRMTAALKAIKKSATDVLPTKRKVKVKKGGA